MAISLSTAMLYRDDPAVTVHAAAEDIGWQALGPAIGCTILAMTVVWMRWYARLSLAKCVGADDYAILISVVLVFLMTTFTGFQVHHGINGASEFLSPVEIAKLITVNNVLWILTVNVTKLSILLQYLRVFSGRVTRTFCYFLIATLLPVASWGIFAGVFMCAPVGALWDPRISGECLDPRNYFIAVSAMDIGLDFIILTLPMPAVLGLRLPKKQKIGLVLVFWLGFFVCAVSIIRLLSVVVASVEGEHVTAGLWSIVWSSVEANVGIICASLLALKPLIVKLWPGMMDVDEAEQSSMCLNLVDETDAPTADLEKGPEESGSDSAADSRESSTTNEKEVERRLVLEREGTHEDGPPSPAEDSVRVFRQSRPLERVLDEGWRLEGQEGWGTPTDSQICDR